MGSQVQKVPTIVVVAAIGSFDTANATPGTFVLDQGTGIVWVVRLVGATRSLLQLGTGGADPNLTRAFTLAATPGAGGSGDVAYALTVVNGAAAPVPRALVFVGVERIVGAGALAVLSVTQGTVISALDIGGDNIALVIQASSLGQVAFTISGTPGDSITTLTATDAPNGGVLGADPGRVLP
jgi:hypothetical protein